MGKKKSSNSHVCDVHSLENERHIDIHAQNSLLKVSWNDEFYQTKVCCRTGTTGLNVDFLVAVQIVAVVMKPFTSTMLTLPR